MNALTKGRTRSTSFLFLLFLLVAVTLGLAGGLGGSLRAAALSRDPSLATAPWETLWGLLSFPIENLLAGETLLAGNHSGSMIGASSTPFLFLLAILYTFVVRKIRSGGSEISVAVVVSTFALNVILLSRILESKDLCAGPEILLFAFLLLPYLLTSPPEDPADPRYLGPMNRTALFLGGLAAGLGAVYLLILAPALRKTASALPMKVWKWVLPFFLLPSLAFSIQRIRYPNPDLPPLENLWSELANAWLYGRTILDGAFGNESGPILFAFPGLNLGFAWLLSLGFVRLCSFAWRTSAGRTVPAQVFLLLLPVVYALALFGGYRWREAADTADEPRSLEERLNYARALHETLPIDTLLYASRDLYDAIVYLHACEGVRNRVDLAPGANPFRTLEGFTQQQVQPAYSRNPAAYSEGTNRLGIAGEPLVFAPQHLYDATEVYLATPTYFIGGKPAPELFQGENRFDPKDGGDLRLLKSTYDGEHIYLFREHVDPIWRPLGGGWRLSYYGFLLEKDLKAWNRPLAPRPRQELQEFYK